MNFSYYEEIKYIQFDSYDQQVRHGVFTRRGGNSPDPWKSLNLGGTVGDDGERVKKNQQKVFNSLGLDIKTKYDIWQVHGSNLIHAIRPRPHHLPKEKGDILITNRPDVTLLMRFADCTPVFLFDPSKKVIGLVHAGWKGTVEKAVQVAVKAMVNDYGCKSVDILAGIGPSIGVDHYEIGHEVATKVKDVFGNTSETLRMDKDGRLFFDLSEANKQLLENCGVRKIEVSNICTACNISDWFSHRGENGKTGRFGALLSLEDVNGKG